MVDLITNIGEEWFYETNTDGATVNVALYNDSTDSLGEVSVLADITTEPTGGAYARQSVGVSTRNSGGSFGIDNDSSLTFDVSDSSETVDAFAIIVNFQSDTVAGDSGANDHVVAAGDMQQSRDTSQIDEVQVSAGDINIEDM